MDIQSLIDDIDGILLMAASRPLWFKPGDPVRERQVLERVRSYLVSQQQSVVTSQQGHSGTTNTVTAAAQQIVQAVSQEMAVIRSGLIEPLQADLKALRQQRESLVEEIRQMELSLAKLDSSQPSAAQQFISEFSQELMNRCTASLTQQFGHILEDLETRWSAAIVATEAASPVSTRASKVRGAITPQERIEQLRQLQAESDRLLVTLDANQRVIFEAIQSNLQSYQASLSQGLENMHSLGTQGETLFSALINRLAQQLGREASTLLQSSLQADTNLTAQLETASLPNEVSTNPPEIATPLLPSQKPTVENPPSEYEALTPDNFAEQLNSEDWEIIEGLEPDTASVEMSDRLDTFLQLDLEDTNSATPQDFDYLLGLIDQSATPLDPLSRQGELTGQEAIEQAAELNVISDQRRQEIDDLYKSLFGGDSLINPTTSDTADHAFLQEETAPQVTAIPNQINSELMNAQELLFDGLVDPAIQSTQGHTLDWSTQTSVDWDLFIENSRPSPDETETGVNSIPSESLELETISTITALTDLFEEMGLSAVSIPTNSTPVSSEPTAAEPSQADSPASLVDDLYIAASPDEDLLATEALEEVPERSIQLDQNALQQLSNDLYSFEEGLSGNFYSAEAMPLADASRAAVGDASTPQGGDRFLMSDELLAEDWEEFVFPSWPDDDLTSNLSEETTSNSEAESGAAPSLPEALDFEPDLFPSEALEFDSESVNNVADSEAAAMSGTSEHLPEEYIAFEDEIVIDEMEWDEPTDSEAVATLGASGMMDAIGNSPSAEQGAIQAQHCDSQPLEPESSEAVATLGESAQQIASPLEFGEPAKQEALLIGQEDAPNPDSTTPVAEEASTNGQTPENLAEADTATPSPKLLAPTENIFNAEAPSTSVTDLDSAQAEGLNLQIDQEIINPNEQVNLSEPTEQETKNNSLDNP